MYRLFILLCIALFFWGCAAPRTMVKTDDQAGTLQFKVKPGYADIYVNGKSMGQARDYDGKSAVLKLRPGTHIIDIKAEGFKPQQRKVYLSDTQEVIEVQLEKK